MSGTGLLITAVATIVAALLAAADGAVMARQHDARGTDPGDPGAPPRDPRQEAERTHRALALARVVALLAAGAAAADATGLTRSFEGTPLVAMTLATLAIVALVEGAARTYGYTLRDRAWSRLRWVARATEIVLAPPLAIANAIETRVTAALPSRQDDEDREMSSEQFRQVVEAEAEEAGVSRHEAALLRGAFTLGETEVREVMVPRVDIVGVELDMPWSEVVDRARSAEHARLPAFRESLDDIVGVLYVKDLLPAVIADAEPADGWQALVRPTTFIPTSRPIDEQLRDFQTSRAHMAVVIDEFGGTAGIVTIEDILEEIVGEIQDEHDEEEPPIESEGNRRHWISGRVTIDELSDVLAQPLEIDGVTTVGGLVYTHLGRVPRPGEAFTLGAFKVVVERVRRRRIERVYFERLAHPPAPDATGSDA